MTRVLLGIGAGIAAYKCAALASSLVQDGHEVRVAMTADATRFVGPVTFGGLTGRPVILSSTQIDPDGKMPHLEAAQEAEVYAIAPATADLLARLAAGAGADPVSLLALTCRCPVLVCPAMNDAMWTAAVVQRNVARLAERGLHRLGPATGHLAEGYDAIGRMVEPDEIQRELLALAAGRA